MSDGYIKGQPDVGWWMQQIYSGEQFRKKYAMEPKWNQWRNYYRGNWPPGVLPNNLFFKMIRTLVPRVYYRNPSISISPAMPGMDNVILAKILQRVDNKLMIRMGVKEQIKRSIQTAIMFGTGIGKLGYGAEYTPTPEMLGTEAPEAGTARTPKQVEYNDLVIPNSPWFMSVHPGRFIVPQGSLDLHSCRWVAHKVTRSLYDVQADERLSNTSSLKASASSFTDKIKTDTIPEPVDLLEIRDRKTGRVIILAPHGDNNKRILYNEKDDMQVNGRMPFYPIIFNMDDEVFWGVPDSHILEPLQHEANSIRSTIMEHRRNSIIKLLAKRGAITEDEMEKLIDGTVKPIVQVDGEVATDIRELPQSGIPAGLLQSDQLTDQEVKEILGMGVNQFGEYARGSADRSATEAQIVNQATQIRVDERRDVVADMLVDVITDMHYIMFEHWQGEQVVDLVGPDGAQIWVKFRPDMLRHGQYEVKVDPDSSVPETKQLREQKAVQAYQILRQDPNIDPMGLTRFLVNSFYGVQYDNLLLKNLPPQTSPQNPMDVKALVQHLQQARGNVVPMRQ